MTELATFVWAASANAAVEVLRLYGYAEAGRPYPRRYRRLDFWVLRTLTAVIAGGIAVAFGIERPLYAVYAGAAGPPLLVEASRRGVMLLGRMADIFRGDSNA